ncbi:hypothetical protein SNE40_000894 [Patella caerulea]|uniref:Box C/D snoRNA protein 1 n=1 Tax=Patella caerulea TaxID=87958 RepID=A0AAN8KD85_PATCE
MPSFRCQVCEENIAKYTCPRCKRKTCSLVCVKKHKYENKCDGIRDKTAHVAVKDFTDRDLLSDYRFLEDTSRKTNSITRDVIRLEKEKPRMLNQLIREAKNRGIDLKVLPYPMTRRKTNTTRYFRQEKIIFWRVDLVFPQASVKYTEKRIDENTSLDEILKNYISPTESDPVIRQKLKQYVRTMSDEIKIFLLVENRPSNDKRYFELDSSKTLKQNLTEKTILENPVLTIVLKKNWSEYTLLSEEEELEVKEKLKLDIAKPVVNGKHNWSRQNLRSSNNRRRHRPRNRNTNYDVTP